MIQALIEIHHGGTEGTEEATEPPTLGPDRQANHGPLRGAIAQGDGGQRRRAGRSLEGARPAAAGPKDRLPTGRSAPPCTLRGLCASVVDLLALSEPYLR